MAHLFPPIETIYSFKIKPTEGELHLLQFLNDNLDDSYEIYFQPWINGDNPDIVVMRKNSGVMIIEVKDWRLEEYSLDDKKNWILLSDKTVIKSPLFQVLSYKNNLFDLHIDNLCKIYMYKKDMFSIVSLGIYFHNAKENEINCFIRNKFLNDSKYIKNLNYFDLLGRDSLSKKNLDNIIQNRRLNKNSKLFTNEIYDSFKRYLQPSEHTIELGKIIQYNKEQTELINNNLKEQKIKGIAGSGKTKVLAKKAVKFHTETNEKVLILCYNIALRNYIRDKISEVRENFNWSAFEISHYHDFITQQMNNYNIVFEFPDNFDELSKSERNEFFNSYYSDINLFEKVEEKIKKYSAVLIDETQDFPIEWLRIIKKYFLKKTAITFCLPTKNKIFTTILWKLIQTSEMTGNQKQISEAGGMKV